MLKVLALTFFDSLLLQPIRCVIGFLMRFTWYPPEYQVEDNSLKLEELKTKADKLYNSLDRDKYGIDNDSAKFLGMLAFAKPDKEFSNFMKLVDDSGNIKRCLKEPYDDEIPDFSTDMLSGLILGVYGNLNNLSEEDREKLTKVWDKATWEGFPLLISSFNKGKALFKRGHVYRFWWVIGSEEILMALSWLYLGYKLTNSKKYLICYWFMMIMLLPSILFACPDAQVFIGRLYHLSAHNTHSRVLIDYVGYKLTKSIWFKRALSLAYKRHGKYNADVAVLVGDALANPLAKLEAINLVTNALNKGAYPSDISKKYYKLSIPLKSANEASTFQLPSYRGNDYVWERSPLYGYTYTAKQRKSRGLDIIFPVEILERSC